MRSKTAVPVPALAVNGTRAVITGVRFSWMISCWKCREVACLHVGDGKILAGLEVSRSGKTCRWYEAHKPPKMPAPPGTCEACGETDRPYAFASDRWRALAHPNTMPVLDEVWRTLRAGFPDLAAKADKARSR
jgi:hypothetical protein